MDKNKKPVFVRAITALVLVGAMVLVAVVSFWMGHMASPNIAPANSQEMSRDEMRSLIYLISQRNSQLESYEAMGAVLEAALLLKDPQKKLLAWAVVEANKKRIKSVQGTIDRATRELVEKKLQSP